MFIISVLDNIILSLCPWFSNVSFARAVRKSSYS